MWVRLSTHDNARVVVEYDRFDLGRRTGHVASRHDYSAPNSVTLPSLVPHCQGGS